jgi:hypothetical protein
MRYIPTSDQVVEQLKKQAKKLKRAGGGKHSDLLDRVAKQAGYNHWHHVVSCNESATAASQLRSIREECESIIAAEQRGQVKVVVTKDGIACPPFVLFSTGIGDAWLLEPDENLAMCLMWHGGREEIGVSNDPSRIQVAWDGAYELLGDFMHVDTDNPRIGERTLAGYPLVEVRKMLDRVQSAERKALAVIGQLDAVEIDDQVVAQLSRKGFPMEEIMQF